MIFLLSSTRLKKHVTQYIIRKILRFASSTFLLICFETIRLEAGKYEQVFRQDIL